MRGQEYKAPRNNPAHLLLVAASALGIVTTVASCRSASHAASDPPITRAYVRGIGEVVGYVKPDAPVRPPARVPHTRFITGPEMHREMADFGRLLNAVHPSSDSGPRDVVAQVRRDVTADLFLDQAVAGCNRIPPAAFAVKAYIWTRPSRRAELDNLRSNQPGRDVGQACRPTRLRVALWQGIRVQGSSATAMLTGYREWRLRGRWKAWGPPGRTVFRMRLRLLDGRWRLAVMDQEYPDDTET